MADVQQLLTRFNNAKSYSDRFRKIFEDCYRYSSPGRNPYYIDSGKRTEDIFDNESLICTNSFVAQLQSALVPIGLDWANLVSGSKVPDELKDMINIYLADITKIFFKYLHSSNWDMVVNEALFDLSIGTLSMMIKEQPSDDEPFTFEAIPLNQIILEQTGSVPRNVFRLFEDLPIRDIRNLWPMIDIPNDLSVDPEFDTNKITMREMTIYRPDTKDYCYYVIDGKTNSFLLQEEGLQQSPFVIARYSVRPLDTYGTGVVMNSLPSIKTLNKMAEYELKSAETQAYPIYLGYDDGIFNPNTAVLEPNTIIPTDADPTGRMPLQPLQQAGNPNFVQLQVADYRRQLNRLFFTDPLGNLQDPKMTATEVMLRNQMTLEAREPSFVRLQSEFLGQVIERCLKILENKGLIPRIPLNGKDVSVKYSSPVAKSQGLANVNKLLQSVQTVQNIVGPQLALATLKPEAISPYIYEQMGVDPALYNTKEEISQVIQQQQQAVQASQQQAQFPTPPQSATPFQGVQ